MINVKVLKAGGTHLCGYLLFLKSSKIYDRGVMDNQNRDEILALEKNSLYNLLKSLIKHHG